MDRLGRAHSFLEGGFELRDDIVAFDASNIKAFGPPLQDSVVDELLCGRIGEGEAERDLANLLEVFVFMVILNKLLDTVGHILPELISSARLQLLRHAVL